MFSKTRCVYAYITASSLVFFSFSFNFLMKFESVSRVLCAATDVVVVIAIVVNLIIFRLMCRTKCTCHTCASKGRHARDVLHRLRCVCVCVVTIINIRWCSYFFVVVVIVVLFFTIFSWNIMIFCCCSV